MRRREYELAIQLPERVRLVHRILTDDPAGIEAYWHKRLEQKRANGEWFKLDAADIQAFKRRSFMSWQNSAIDEARSGAPTTRKCRPTVLRLWRRGVHSHAGRRCLDSLVRDINEHRHGEPMLKDLHLLLPDALSREFRNYINRPENFLKHADKDPDAVAELEPRWTEVLIWEASRKYCEMTGKQNKILITFCLLVCRAPA